MMSIPAGGAELNATLVERLTRAVATIVIAVAATGQASAAGTFTVSNANNAGAGSLRQAILDANAAGGGTINVNTGGIVTLTIPLPIISAATTLNGNNLIVSGNNQNRVFFVDAPAGAAVTFNNLAIINGRATGGAGGNGAGGGLGAGGGIFVSSGALTLSNVTFSGNAAVGGKGGDSLGITNQYGGGGGLGGFGGSAAGGGGGYLGGGGQFSGGGGGMDTEGGAGRSIPDSGGTGGGQGGVGPAFGGGTPSVEGGGGGGSLASPGGNASGGTGGNGGRYGGGGGGASLSSTAQGIGGNGGDFGGGGGARDVGGKGGFGGGGGAGGNIAGGDGGFGGGGGGSAGYAGAAGAFAGAGYGDIDPNYTLGGGGAALGGHVFVRAGASLALVDVGSDAGNVTGGAGGHTPPNAQPLSADGGQIRGSAFFLSGPTTFTVSAGQTRSIGGGIADVADIFGTPTTTGFARAKLTKSGAGTLALNAGNVYTGGTLISQGTLQAASESVGVFQEPVAMNDAATGAADTTLLVGPDVFFHPIDVANAGSGVTTIGSIVSAATPTVFAYPLTLGRSVTLLGQNNTTLPANHDGGQMRFDGAISGAGGLTLTGGRMVQFRSDAKTYTGLTHITGNTTLSLWDSASTPLNSTVQIDAGSTLVLENVAPAAAVLGGLSGPGTVAQNPAYFRAVLNIGNNNADAAFTGAVTGRVSVTKVGTGTQSWGAQDNTAMGIIVQGGRLKLTGNQHVVSLSVAKADAGTQSLDLNGKSVDLESTVLISASIESDLDHSMGTAADGIYDSTAAPGQAVGLTWTSGSTHVLMKLTRAGDANLDGVVGFEDLVVVAQHYNTSGQPTWDQGDFNYDDAVNFADLVTVAQNYGQSLPSSSVPGASAEFGMDLAAAFASVPEPSSVVLLAATAAAAMNRRRARQS
jgi:autotransporter-associated beta strand protein